MNDKNSTVNGKVNEWTILSLSTVFFFTAQLLFNAFGGLMIQCWCWLQWKKKVEIFFYIYIYIHIYIYIWRWGLWVIQNEWNISVLVFTRTGWLYVERYLNARKKLRRGCRMLDLKYQQSELDFCAKSLSQGDQNSCVLFCQLSMYGEGYCMWEYSLSFLERMIIKWLNFYKKIFSKT